MKRLHFLETYSVGGLYCETSLFSNTFRPSENFFSLSQYLLLYHPKNIRNAVIAPPLLRKRNPSTLHLIDLVVSLGFSHEQGRFAGAGVFSDGLAGCLPVLTGVGGAKPVALQRKCSRFTIAFRPRYTASETAAV
ncbi:hypothetical protein [Neisseria musculi]|uniref:hypothetical protein n=1 Tax=Neisseria musculi TaxID=1815583 RepID=UPI00164A3281|nr:hypothetical protein [Neisseria musculi]